MLELEPISAIRVVATPAAIDRARWPGGSLVARVAPDEALVIGPDPHALDDPHALVVRDGSLVASDLSAEDVREIIWPRVPWMVPQEAGFAQGLLGGVPVKVLVRADGSGLVLTSRAFAEELRERLA